MNAVRHSPSIIIASLPVWKSFAVENSLPAPQPTAGPGPRRLEVPSAIDVSDEVMLPIEERFPLRIVAIADEAVGAYHCALNMLAKTVLPFP